MQETVVNDVGQDNNAGYSKKRPPSSPNTLEYRTYAKKCSKATYLRHVQTPGGHVCRDEQAGLSRPEERHRVRLREHNKYVTVSHSWAGKIRTGSM